MLCFTHTLPSQARGLNAKKRCRHHGKVIFSETIATSDEHDSADDSPHYTTSIVATIMSTTTGQRQPPAQRQFTPASPAITGTTMTPKRHTLTSAAPVYYIDNESREDDDDGDRANKRQVEHTSTPTLAAATATKTMARRDNDDGRQADKQTSRQAGGRVWQRTDRHTYMHTPTFMSNVSLFVSERLTTLPLSWCVAL